MKTENNILIAFVLNLAFAALELFGGMFTGSVAIVSDAVHDLGDAVSIGISYFLENKSKKKPDDTYTYGYVRYSLIGSVISTLILLFGSIMVMYYAIGRIIKPISINYDGMMLFAVLGVFVNATAAFFTRQGDSLNQRAVNLHMLEDVFGWMVVLIGAIVIRCTGFLFIDPIMSMGVAVFILTKAIMNLKETIGIFLEKTPDHINVNEIEEHIKSIEGVIDVHHIHIWTMDGQNNYATMHVVTNENHYEIKQKIREALYGYEICHITIELEKEEEDCHEKVCQVNCKKKTRHCH